MTMCYNRSVFQPVRRAISVADLQAALPRLYCCSYMNRNYYMPLDPADDRLAEPAWNVTIEQVHKQVGFDGLGDFIEIRVTRDYKNYAEITTAWASLNGVFKSLDIRFDRTYKNGYTEESYKAYIEQPHPDAYKKIAYDRHISMMESMKDCLEDWVNSVSIVRYEPKTQ